jgi:hypothetical protein
MANDRVIESLGANRQNFTFKKPGPGTGKFIQCCKLNRAAFVTMKTPEYTDGMTVEEASAAWASYVRAWQPKNYPKV